MFVYHNRTFPPPAPARCHGKIPQKCYHPIHGVTKCAQKEIQFHVVSIGKSCFHSSRVATGAGRTSRYTGENPRVAGVDPSRSSRRATFSFAWGIGATETGVTRSVQWSQRLPRQTRGFSEHCRRTEAPSQSKSTGARCQNTSRFLWWLKQEPPIHRRF